MFTELLTDPTVGHTIIEAAATGGYRSGIFDWGNGFISNVDELWKNAVRVIVVIIVSIVAFKTRLAFASTAIAALAGGLIIWLVTFGGAEWIGEQVRSETSASSSVTVPESLI